MGGGGGGGGKEGGEGRGCFLDQAYNTNDIYESSLSLNFGKSTSEETVLYHQQVSPAKDIGKKERRLYATLVDDLQVLQ